jgi:hypothetical protein
MIQPSRRSQPYRKGQQNPGFALHNMQAGKPAFLPNPADMRRYQQSVLALLIKGQQR